MSRRVGIIGGGVAGLSAIRSLKSRGVPCVAFEKANNLGGVWRDNYLNSGLQVGNEMYHFPDFEFLPSRTGNHYATRQEVQTYVEDFAQKLDLDSHIQYNSEVTRAEQQRDGSWLLSLQGQGEKQHVDSLIVCNGMYNKPKLLPRELFSEFEGKVMHSSEVKFAEDFAGKRVVVVGGGKSAMDVASAIKQQLGAKTCTVLSRRAHWMTPPKVLNLIPFEYIFLSRMGQMLVDLHVGFWPTLANGKGGEGYAVMRPVFKLVEAILALQYGFKRGSYYPSADVAADLYLCANVASSNEFKARLRDQVFQLKVGEIDTCEGNKLKLKQKNEELDCDVVVCATGFDKSYDIFDEATKSRLQVEKDGLYLYRKVVPPQVERLFFCGSESTFIYNICGSALQAEWIARVLQGEIVLPNKLEMQNEVDKSKQWARRWIPEHGQRASQVMLHQIHAWDDLLRDMGVNPKRKSNPLAEFFMPYLPSDYNGIIKQ